MAQLTAPPPAPLPLEPRPCQKCRRRQARAEVRWYARQIAAGVDPTHLDAGEPSAIRYARAALRRAYEEWRGQP